MTNIFNIEDICFNVLLFVQNIVDIYHLSKVNPTLRECVDNLSSTMCNLQFSLINFGIAKKWKFILNPKKIGKCLISYTPSLQIFFNGDEVCEKFCCVFYPKTRTLEVYEIHLPTISHPTKIVWDGCKVCNQYVKGGRFEGSITECGVSGLSEVEKYSDINYLQSIVFPSGWIFHKLNENYHDYDPYFLKYNNQCLIKFNLSAYVGVRVIKFDERGVHFLFHSHQYQSQNNPNSFTLMEKFYYGLFDFKLKKFSMLARSEYVSTLSHLSHPKFCDILIKSKKKSYRYFIKSTRHRLIPLKNSTKTPKIIKSVQIF